jgi:hypothetical protein
VIGSFLGPELAFEFWPEQAKVGKLADTDFATRRVNNARL